MVMPTIATARWQLPAATARICGLGAYHQALSRATAYAQRSHCSLRGGVGGGTRCLSDARRFSRVQHALMRGLTDSKARRVSTRRPRHACSIPTDQPPRVALVARTAVSDLAARLGVHHNDVESSNLDGHSAAALWWRFSKAPPRPNPQTPPPRGAMGREMRCRPGGIVEGA